MTRLSARVAALAAAGLVAQPVLAQSAKPAPGPVIEIRDGKAINPGSLYLQCDGNPNNMSAGESLARLVGAVTLLGIFAPRVESPDPSKRQFGQAGVGACTSLIDGEKQETNLARRLPLILARALHRIEVHGAAATPAEHWTVGFRVRDVAQAPDGALWLIEDSHEGSLYRLTPK